MVNVDDMTRVYYLREQPKAAKHVAFDPDGAQITVSCTDGVVYVYSFGSDEPELLRKIDGLVRALESEDQSSSATAWHPDGRLFAAPSPMRGKDTSMCGGVSNTSCRDQNCLETRLGEATSIQRRPQR